MPNNIILTPNVILKGILASLGEKSMLHVVRNMNTEIVGDAFGTPDNKGHKPGDTVSILKPQRFTVSHQLDYDPQPIQNTKVAVKVGQISQVAYDWNSIEKTLSITDAIRRYFNPAALALANDTNRIAAEFIARNAINWVGTPHQNPTAMSTYLEAEDRLIELGMGENEELHCVVNRRMSSAYVDANKGLFNDQRIIAKQMNSGRVENTLGWLWDIDETIYSHTVGALGGTPLLNWTSPVYTTEGDNSETTLVLTGCGSVTNYARYGDKFSITNLHSVHPQTRVSTARDKQFTVLQDATSVGGALTLRVAPGITPTGQYQNVDAVPTDNQQVLFWNGTTAAPNAAAGLNFKCGLLFHKDAFAFVPVKFDDPKAGMGALVSSQKDDVTGMWLSFWQQADGVHRVEINRIDALWDVAWLYRELACVVCGF